MKNNLSSEQQEVFARYFKTEGHQHISNTLQYAHFHIAFFDFEVYRDTDVVLEIKVGHTSIAMWKQVEHVIITIL